MRGNARFRLLLGVLLLTAGLSGCAPEAVPRAIVSRQYTDMSFFLTAIKRSAVRPLPQPVTGITVPHHLLARDIMADTVALASGRSYDRIILLSPDHFFRGKTGISVSYQSFDTVFGTLAPDLEVFDALRGLPDVGPGDFFSNEHGINAVTPFLKYHFPDAEFTAVTFKGTSSRESLRRLADALEGVLTDRTLVVQSTDFSHYLAQPEAATRDQQTLLEIASGDPNRILTLNQPANMDSLQAQWMQMTLQWERFGAFPTVTENRNSQDYALGEVAETTSYIAQVYTSQPAPLDGAGTYAFAGDTMMGRGLAEFARDSGRRATFVDRVLSLTGGAPMIVNLEGVMMDVCPLTENPWLICMETEDTIALLQDLRIAAVSVANNHAMDFGRQAYESMIGALQQRGIRVLERDSFLDFQEFRLYGFTDLDNSPTPTGGLLYEQGIDTVISGAGATALPSFAFVHWGDEYRDGMDNRQQALAGLFQHDGIGMLIGAHSHRASTMLCNGSGCVVPSLGNFLFDQAEGGASGQILKVIFFKQGTYFPQVLPL